jgi:membrane-bound serine protease (ClpP class)
VLFVVTGLFGLSLTAPHADEGDRDKPLAYAVEINGGITPSTFDLVDRELTAAANAHADIVVLEIQTPGGLYESMQQIIQDILKSPVPVATFVYPPGSRAASAGTYILYGSQIAAMAPSTNIGSATPINMFDENKRKDDTPETAKLLAQPQTTLEKKVVNDAAAFIRSLAQRYDRNGEWAEAAVRDSVAQSANEALAKHCIDVIANDTPDLLDKIDGRTVKMAGDKTMKLRTKGAKIIKIKPDWRTALLDVITNPSIAAFLFTIGTTGLIYECFHPGVVLPGVAGAICLVLSLFAFNVLPVNYTGLSLMLLGMGLMIAEAFAPSFGALGIGGAISFAVGATMLIDSTDPNFAVDPWMIAGVTLFCLAVFSVLLTVALRAQRRPTVTGIEELKAATAEVIDWSQGAGQVRVTGEIWMAKTAGPEFIINPGDKVKVIDVDGLKLIVKPAGTAKE